MGRTYLTTLNVHIIDIKGASRKHVDLLVATMEGIEVTIREGHLQFPMAIKEDQDKKANKV